MSTEDLRSFRRSPDVRVPFAVKQLLGRGTFGSAWKVHLSNSKKEFTVKEIKMTSEADKYEVSQHNLGLWSRGLANQQKAAQSSPFVLPVFGWSVELHNNTAFLLIALPLCEGPIVKKDQDTRKVRPLPEELQPYKLLFTIEISEALAVLHGMQMVHCDVQSQNCFIWRAPNGDRHAVLADFGCSLHYGQKEQVEGEHEQAQERKRQLDRRLLTLVYLDMSYGSKTEAMDSLGKSDEISLDAYAELSADKLTPGPERDRKLEERDFLKSLIEGKVLMAAEVKNLPFFSSIIPGSLLPRWADDLRKLSGGHSHSFATPHALCSFLNFLKVTNPVGKDAESELHRFGIKWKPIDATLLEKELKGELKMLPKSTSSSAPEPASAPKKTLPKSTSSSSSKSDKSTSDKSERK